MMEGILPDGIFGIFISIILVAWAILSFLVPFFVYGIWTRSKECSTKLSEANFYLEMMLKNQDGHKKKEESFESVV